MIQSPSFRQVGVVVGVVPVTAPVISGGSVQPTVSVFSDSVFKVNVNMVFCFNASEFQKRARRLFRPVCPPFRIPVFIELRRVTRPFRVTAPAVFRLLRLQL